MDELRKAAGTAVDVWDDTGTRHEDVVNAMNDLRKVLANNANAAPDSSLAPQIESLIAEYWDIAYEEGKTGISQGDLANQVLGRIRNALIAWSQRAAPDTWTSVKAAMPQSGVTVLAYYKNSNGFERRIRAKWTAAKTVEANAEFYWGEYDEETDTYWTPEGWYECIDNWVEYSSVMVSEGEVTHWMPLPLAPDDVILDAALRAKNTGEQA